MINEPMRDVLKAQANLIAHLTERMVLMQVAFEAYVRQEIGEHGPKHDAHYALRKEMVAKDFAGKTNDLLCTLNKALARVDSFGKN